MIDPMTDDALLASLDQKLQLVRDRVQGVAEGYQNGFYLWGEGGTSKSYTVLETLNRLGAHYKLTNTRVTAKALYLTLKKFPDAVHVIEDAETLLRDKNASGVLRSALWGQVGSGEIQERVVCWQTAREQDEFVFEGGIIMVANRALDDTPELRAVKTRIAPMQYLATNREVAALMRHIARKGHVHGPHVLTPEKCLEVAQAIIERSARLTRNLDLRLLVNTFADRIQYENGHAETHWLDLLNSRMKERVVAPTGDQGVWASAKELEFLQRNAALPTAEQLDLWKKEMGKSRATFYRYRRQAGLTTDESHVSQLSQQSHSNEPDTAV